MLSTALKKIMNMVIMSVIAMVTRHVKMAILVLKSIVLQKLVKSKTIYTITKYETYFFPDSCNSSTTPTPVDPSVNYQDNDGKFILLYILTSSLL